MSSLEGAIDKDGVHIENVPDSILNERADVKRDLVDEDGNQVDDENLVKEEDDDDEKGMENVEDENNLENDDYNEEENLVDEDQGNIIEDTKLSDDGDNEEQEDDVPNTKDCELMDNDEDAIEDEDTIKEDEDALQEDSPLSHESQGSPRDSIDTPGTSKDKGKSVRSKRKPTRYQDCLLDHPSTTITFDDDEEFAEPAPKKSKTVKFQLDTSPSQIESESDIASSLTPSAGGSDRRDVAFDADGNYRFKLGREHVIRNRTGGLTSYRCDVCEMIFPRSFSLRRHYERIHINPRFVRNKGKKDQEMVRKLMANDRKKKLMKKEEKDNISNSQASHSSEKDPSAAEDTSFFVFACKLCSRHQIFFKTKEQLCKHYQNRHTAISRKKMDAYKCETCDRSYMTRHELQRHKRSHSGERPYACRYCAKRFPTSTNARRHERTHTGDRTHICKVCARRFVQKSDLLQHMRTVHRMKVTRTKAQRVSKQEKDLSTPSAGESNRFEENIDFAAYLKLDRFEKGSLMGGSDIERQITTPSISSPLSPTVKAGKEEKNRLPKDSSSGQDGDKLTPQKCPECFKTFSSRVNMRRHFRLKHERNQVVRSALPVSMVVKKYKIQEAEEEASERIQDLEKLIKKDLNVKVTRSSPILPPKSSPSSQSIASTPVQSHSTSSSPLNIFAPSSSSSLKDVSSLPGSKSKQGTKLDFILERLSLKKANEGKTPPHTTSAPLRKENLISSNTLLQSMQTSKKKVTPQFTDGTFKNALASLPSSGLFQEERGKRRENLETNFLASVPKMRQALDERIRDQEEEIRKQDLKLRLHREKQEMKFHSFDKDEKHPWRNANRVNLFSSNRAPPKDSFIAQGASTMHPRSQYKDKGRVAMKDGVLEESHESRRSFLDDCWRSKMNNIPGQKPRVQDTSTWHPPVWAPPKKSNSSFTLKFLDPPAPNVPLNLKHTNIPPKESQSSFPNAPLDLSHPKKTNPSFSVTDDGVLDLSSKTNKQLSNSKPQVRCQSDPMTKQFFPFQPTKTPIAAKPLHGIQVKDTWNIREDTKDHFESRNMSFPMNNSLPLKFHSVKFDKDRLVHGAGTAGRPSKSITTSSSYRRFSHQGSISSSTINQSFPRQFLNNQKQFDDSSKDRFRPPRFPSRHLPRFNVDHKETGKQRHLGGTYPANPIPNPVLRFSAPNFSFTNRQPSMAPRHHMDVKTRSSSRHKTPPQHHVIKPEVPKLYRHSPPAGVGKTTDQSTTRSSYDQFDEDVMRRCIRKAQNDLENKGLPTDGRHQEIKNVPGISATEFQRSNVKEESLANPAPSAGGETQSGRNSPHFNVAAQRQTMEPNQSRDKLTMTPGFDTNGEEDDSRSPITKSSTGLIGDPCELKSSLVDAKPVDEEPFPIGGAAKDHAHALVDVSADTKQDKNQEREVSMKQRNNYDESLDIEDILTAEAMRKLSMNDKSDSEDMESNEPAQSAKTPLTFQPNKSSTPDSGVSDEPKKFVQKIKLRAVKSQNRDGAKKWTLVGDPIASGDDDCGSDVKSISDQGEVGDCDDEVASFSGLKFSPKVEPNATRQSHMLFKQQSDRSGFEGTSCSRAKTVIVDEQKSPADSPPSGGNTSHDPVKLKQTMPWKSDDLALSSVVDELKETCLNMKSDEDVNSSSKCSSEEKTKEASTTAKKSSPGKSSFKLKLPNFQFDYSAPKGNKLNLQQPEPAPVTLQQPVPTPVTLEQPVLAQAKLHQPMPTPVTLQKPVPGTVKLQQPVATPVAVLAPATLQQQVPAPAALQKPVETPDTLQNPVVTTDTLQKPGLALATLQQPVSAPVTLQEPVSAPVTLQEPMVTPATLEKPVPATATLQQPVQAPVTLQEPVVTPATLQQPVPAPATLQTPVVTPATLQKTELTLVTLQEPVVTPATLEQPVPATATLQQPVQALATLQQPVLVPTSLQQPVLAPATLQQPVLAPATLQKPVLAPATFQKPVLAPATFQKPVLAPATLQQPVLAPATLQQPVLVPATLQQPVLAPAALQKPVLAPATFQKPVLAPATFQKPVLAPATFQKPVLAPTTFQKPVLAPSTFQKPVLAPATFQKPVLAPSTFQKPVLAPATSANDMDCAFPGMPSNLAADGNESSSSMQIDTDMTLSNTPQQDAPQNMDLSSGEYGIQNSNQVDASAVSMDVESESESAPVAMEVNAPSSLPIALQPLSTFGRDPSMEVQQTEPEKPLILPGHFTLRTPPVIPFLITAHPGLFILNEPMESDEGAVEMSTEDRPFQFVSMKKPSLPLSTMQDMSGIEQKGSTNVVSMQEVFTSSAEIKAERIVFPPTQQAATSIGPTLDPSVGNPLNDLFGPRKAQRTTECKNKIQSPSEPTTDIKKPITENVSPNFNPRFDFSPPKNAAEPSLIEDTSLNTDKTVPTQVKTSEIKIQTESNEAEGSLLTTDDPLTHFKKKKICIREASKKIEESSSYISPLDRCPSGTKKMNEIEETSLSTGKTEPTQVQTPEIKIQTKRNEAESSLFFTPSKQSSTSGASLPVSNKEEMEKVQGATKPKANIKNAQQLITNTVKRKRTFDGTEEDEFSQAERSEKEERFIELVERNYAVGDGTATDHKSDVSLIGSRYSDNESVESNQQVGVVETKAHCEAAFLTPFKLPPGLVLPKHPYFNAEKEDNDDIKVVAVDAILPEETDLSATGDYKAISPPKALSPDPSCSVESALSNDVNVEAGDALPPAAKDSNNEEKSDEVECKSRNSPSPVHSSLLSDSIPTSGNVAGSGDEDELSARNSDDDLSADNSLTPVKKKTICIREASKKIEESSSYTSPLHRCPSGTKKMKDSLPSHDSSTLHNKEDTSPPAKEIAPLPPDVVIPTPAKASPTQSPRDLDESKNSNVIPTEENVPKPVIKKKRRRIIRRPSFAVAEAQKDSSSPKKDDPKNVKKQDQPKDAEASSPNLGGPGGDAQTLVDPPASPKTEPSLPNADVVKSTAAEKQDAPVVVAKRRGRPPKQKTEVQKRKLDCLDEDRESKSLKLDKSVVTNEQVRMKTRSFESPITTHEVKKSDRGRKRTQERSKFKTPSKKICEETIPKDEISRITDIKRVLTSRRGRGLISTRGREFPSSNRGRDSTLGNKSKLRGYELQPRRSIRNSRPDAAEK